MGDKLICSACGGDKHLRPYSPWHSIPICNPCFMVWYDGPGEGHVGEFDPSDPKQVGAASLRLKAERKFPWTGDYAP